MKEADLRYESFKKNLHGPTFIEEKEKEMDRKKIIDNVPKGITLTRLMYPQNKSEIILVGLNRRAYIHCSFIYGKSYKLIST